MAGYTRIGASPDAGLSITLPQAMGYEKAMRFMMENRTLQGDDGGPERKCLRDDGENENADSPLR
jgi:hypothetical protein